MIEGHKKTLNKGYSEDRIVHFLYVFIHFYIVFGFKMDSF